ncbi:hypothetical protein [Pseudobacteriovorax antillogorgiicola]|uniref:hypothetical protein n=1 Tax=Pseudobacteriovorax antillogorgiicola TaxID=1513793 RepID=UPI0010441353|nr:hypothetical protein [Pseudobacteriovorax antillogorgiicola]TCS45669.1 hypothetical protein EDD56_12763 [Pseudobacteriovorax antillogorgiicola]
MKLPIPTRKLIHALIALTVFSACGKDDDDSKNEAELTTQKLEGYWSTDLWFYTVKELADRFPVDNLPIFHFDEKKMHVQATDSGLSCLEDREYNIVGRDSIYLAANGNCEEQTIVFQRFDDNLTFEVNGKSYSLSRSSDSFVTFLTSNHAESKDEINNHFKGFYIDPISEEQFKVLVSEMKPQLKGLMISVPNGLDDSQETLKFGSDDQVTCHLSGIESLESDTQEYIQKVHFRAIAAPVNNWSANLVNPDYLKEIGASEEEVQSLLARDIAGSYDTNTRTNILELESKTFTLRCSTGMDSTPLTVTSIKEVLAKGVSLSQ